MNLEAINKWLDEEYGCSYTRLEELHDFYFEKYCDLKKENKQLKDNWNMLKEHLTNRYNNETESISYRQVFIEIREAMQVLEIAQELEQGSDSNDSN